MKIGGVFCENKTYKVGEFILCPKSCIGLKLSTDVLPTRLVIGHLIWMNLEKSKEIKKNLSKLTKIILRVS